MACTCRKNLARALGVFALAIAMGLSNAAHAQGKLSLSVSAAASLKDALMEAESAYQQGHPAIEFRNNFGSSGTLAAQIDQGAPADLFLSAAEKQMNDLQAKGLIVADTRRNLARNTLVLIAPLDSHLTGFAGLTAGTVKTIALGDPASVPAGQYGRQALTNLRLFDKVSAKFVFAKDVRQVLAYVETGNADAGLVYATDALVSNKVRVVATAPEGTHDPIVYPAAVIKGGGHEGEARAFVQFLSGTTAQAIFAKRGFSPPPS